MASTDRAQLYAGHCPTQRFSLAEYEAMPWCEVGDDYIPPDGFHRVLDRAGKAVVVHFDWDTLSGYAVRPIVVAAAT